MRVFRDTGLVEQLGFGMSGILKAYDKSVFQISDHFIKVVLPFTDVVSEKNIDNGTKTGTANSKIGTANGIENKYDNLLSQFSKSKKKKIIQLIKELDQNGGTSQDELAAKIAVGKRTVARYSAELGDMGIVEYLGAAKNGKYVLKLRRCRHGSKYGFRCHSKRFEQTLCGVFAGILQPPHYLLVR